MSEVPVNRNDDVKSNAVLVAERKHKAGQEIITASGVRVKLRSAPANLIQDVMQTLPEPAMPTFRNPETGQDEPNPASPEYEKAMREWNIDRNQAAMDAMMFYGIQLLDPIPPVADWLPDVQYILKRNGIELEVNQEDANEVKFTYLKYVVMDADLFLSLSELTGVTEREVAQAKAQFPG